MDCFHYKTVNNLKSCLLVLDLKEEFNLVDPWKDANMELRRYTWSQPTPIKQGRLDFFLISRNMLHYVQKSDINMSYRSDHSVITLKLKFSNLERGRGYWKFNNSLLKDTGFVTEIKDTIETTVNQYDTTLNAQFLFEMILLNICWKQLHTQLLLKNNTCQMSST